MIDFLEFTSWKMEVTNLYSFEHIAIIVFALLISFSTAYFFRNLNNKKSKMIFGIISLFLLISEIYKELFLSLIVYKRYCWEDFPFQLCSIGMYLYFFIFISKNKKINEIIYTFIATYNLLGGITALIIPIDIFNQYITLTIHSILWHMILCFVGFYTIFSQKCSSDRFTFCKASVLYIIFTVIAYILNFFFMKISKNNMTLFFIGPGKSYIPFFSLISENFGQFAETLIYTIIVMLFSFLIFGVQKKYLKSFVIENHTKK